MMQSMRIGQVPNQKWDVSFQFFQSHFLKMSRARTIPSKCDGLRNGRVQRFLQRANGKSTGVFNLAGEEGELMAPTMLGEGIKKDIEVSKNELTALQTSLKTQFEEAKILLDQRLDKVKTLKATFDGGNTRDS